MLRDEPVGDYSSLQKVSLGLSWTEVTSLIDQEVNPIFCIFEDLNFLHLGFIHLGKAIEWRTSVCERPDALSLLPEPVFSGYLFVGGGVQSKYQ